MSERLGNWLANDCQTVQCMSDDGCGQYFVPMDNCFKLLQINASVFFFCKWKPDLWGFYIAGVSHFGLKRSQVSRAYRLLSDPHLLSSMCCWIFAQFHGHLFGQLYGVNGFCKMCVIQGGIAAPLTSIKIKWDSF